MRSIGAAQFALDTMIERVTDPGRKTFGKFLYEHGEYIFSVKILCCKAKLSSVGTVVADIAKSRAEIEGARLLVLSAAHQVSCILSISFTKVRLIYFARSTKQGPRAL